MKSALLAKAALCICPPVVVATTAATVPPVRHAVHRFTAAYEPQAKRTAPSAPCVPIDRKTFASLLPPGPVDLNDNATAFSALAPGTSGVTEGVGPTLLSPSPPQLPLGPGVLTPTGPTGGGETPGVPEPEVWMTMVLGFGMIGAGFRQRRRYVIRSRKLATAGGAGAGVRARGFGSAVGGAVVAGAALAPVGLSPLRAGTRVAEIGSKALHSSLLAKAAMCVCPTVGMALGTAAVPPVRHAVYNATAPKLPRAPGTALPAATPGVPCVPVVAPADAVAAQPSEDRLAVLQPAANWPG